MWYNNKVFYSPPVFEFALRGRGLMSTGTFIERFAREGSSLSFFLEERYRRALNRIANAEIGTVGVTRIQNTRWRLIETSLKRVC